MTEKGEQMGGGGGVFFFHFSSFLNVYMLFKCRFIA